MKKSVFVLMMFSIFLFSCGGSGENKSESTDQTENTEQASETSADNTINNCDEFLDNYEKWVDDYLAVLEAWQKDPTNIEITQEYTALAQTASTWPTEWVAYASCAAQEKYEKRYQAISDKVDKKLEELGLDE